MSNTKTDDTGYDALVILGGNIRLNDSGYAPSTYDDSDQYGMLGGKIRVIAAALIYLNGECSTFVFSTGTSEKTKAAFGQDVPTEAEVYSKDFVATVAKLRLTLPDPPQQLAEPVLILEDRSQNTVGNIRECFEIVAANPEWHRIAFLSTWPHLGRTKALCEFMGYTDNSAITLSFLSAEDVVTNLRPGEYETEIAAAYASTEGRKRIASETKGVNDIRNGTYVMTEYQLHQGSVVPSTP